MKKRTKIQRTTKLFNEIMKCLLYIDIKVSFIIQKETNHYIAFDSRCRKRGAPRFQQFVYQKNKYLCAVHIFKSQQLITDP